MARIEPIPWEALPSDAREMIQAGLDSGMYMTPLPMQINLHWHAAGSIQNRCHFSRSCVKSVPF